MDCLNLLESLASTPLFEETIMCGPRRLFLVSLKSFSLRVDEVSLRSPEQLRRDAYTENLVGDKSTSLSSISTLS